MSKGSKNLIHENIEIKEQARDRQKMLLRQERHFPEVESCYLEIDRQQCEVLNYSSFGIAISCAEGFNCENELIGVPFIYDDVEVAKLHLHQTRRETQGNGIDIIAFEISGEPINYDKLNAVSTAKRVIQLQQDYIENNSHLPAEVKAQVYEIADWLEHLMAEFEEIEENIKHTNYQSVYDYEETIIQIVAQYLGRVFPAVYNRFDKILQPYEEEIRKQSIDFLRHKLNHIIYQAPFAERVYTKPLGYAGDYEMMNLIYKQENIGKSLFARCLQQYYIDEPAAQAVRNRADYLIGVILKAIGKAKKGEPLRMLSVACGPAMEWQKLLPQLTDCDKEVMVDLLDQDEQALLSTQNCLRQLGAVHQTPVRFLFVRKAIKNIIARGIDEGQYDLIYSAGLFDYLSDPVALMAAKQMFKGLRPGGKLVIGNFNVSNPNRVGMEYALDWELIHRSESDLLELFRSVTSNVDVEKEMLDINLFCVLEKR